MTAMSESRWHSLVTYMVLVACLVAIACIVQLQGGDDGVSAAFRWPIVLSVAAAGLAGVCLARRIGVPEMLDPRVSARRRFATPALSRAPASAW